MAEQEKMQGLSAGAESSADTKASAASRPGIRSRAFRSKLLSRLPRLAASRWNPGDTLDVYKDMEGLVELDADAFLQPLERLTGDQHG